MNVALIFSVQYGKVKEVRMAEEDGHAKGFAFVEFEDEVGLVSLLFI